MPPTDGTTKQGIEIRFPAFFAPCGCRSRLFCIAYAEQTKNFSVLFGVLKNHRYYATKRENEVGKNIFSPLRELAGRKPFFHGLVSEKRAEAALSIALLVEPEKPERPAGIVVWIDAAESVTFLEQDSTTVPKFAYPLILPLRESCWGVPSPNPAMRLAPLIPAALMRELVEKIVIHEAEPLDGKRHGKLRRQNIDIYYSFVGKVDLPE